MARKVCPRCQRAEKVCVCDFIKPIANKIEVGILQHPSETKQVKGTAILAALSLQKCRLWVAEELDEAPDLKAWLAGAKPVYLLYPPTQQKESVEVIDTLNLSQNDPAEYKVLVLDGTWRKTYKMMQINPALQTLPRVTIAPANISAYLIRKQKDSQSLSTIEAIAELLSILEQNPKKFTPLLNAFAQMQQQQLAFRKHCDA